MGRLLRASNIWPPAPFSGGCRLSSSISSYASKAFSSSGFMEVSRTSGVLSLPVGVTIAYQRWVGRKTDDTTEDITSTSISSTSISSSNISCHRILASHGWLDNSNTFAFLGYYLASLGYDFIAIDLPGHGLSSHLPYGTHYFPYCAQTIKLVLDQLGWTNNREKVNIIGHSMGAAINYIFSGAFPEMVNRCILIDQASPITHTSSKAAEKLRNAIISQDVMFSKNAAYGKPKEYATIQDTVNARLKAVATYPGSQSISSEAALILMHRGVVASSEPSDNIDIGDSHFSRFNSTQAGPVFFRHDPKLLLTSYTYFTPEQAISFADRFSFPLYVIQAESGWPESCSSTLLERWRSKGILKYDILPGSHHLHLDLSSADNVAKNIRDFLASE